MLLRAFGSNHDVITASGVCGCHGAEPEKGDLVSHNTGKVPLLLEI
jgi:hypothetical protein